MKKIYWIFALIALFFVGDRIGGFILKKMIETSQFRYSRMYTGQAEAEVLLLGNSRGLIFYQPYISESTGKTNFNLSYNGMSIDLGHVLVQDYYERYKAPELLLIDVTMCDRENDQLSNGFSCYSSFSPRIDSFLMAKSPTTAYAGCLTHLFRYNSEVFQRALSYIGRSDENWLTDRIINDHLVANAEQETPLDFSFAEAKGNGTLDEEYILNQLKATIDLAKSKGTQVELVINPYYPAFVTRSLAYTEWKAKVEKVTGMKIRDYSVALKERDSFGDYQHLNKKGSIEYLDLLRRDGILK